MFGEVDGVFVEYFGVGVGGYDYDYIVEVCFVVVIVGEVGVIYYL